MSKFIKVTPTSGGDKAYYVLASAITVVGVSIDDSTFIQVGSYVQVTESPEEIIKLIEDASEDRESFVEVTASGLRLSFPVKSVSWVHETQEGKTAIKLIAKEVTVLDQSYKSLIDIKAIAKEMSKVSRVRRIK